MKTIDQPAPHGHQHHDKGGDCLPIHADIPPPSRLSRRHLQYLANRLDQRAWHTLSFLAEHRFATTRQLARHHQDRHATAASALRQTSRLMRHLADQRLTAHLERRIGGQRAGSTGLIWHLTEAGHRILAIQSGNTSTSRHRYSEPSPTFATHTLAITEARVRAEEATRTLTMRLTHIETEPLSWRRHLGPRGQIEWVKPDLALTTTLDGYEDHWWLEIDQGTEHPKRLLSKAHAYLRHYEDGCEQATRGVHPVIVWVTATTSRAHQIRDLLASRPELPDGMFTTCHIDNLTAVLTYDQHIAVENHWTLQAK